jgi:hypothetical protein
MAFINDDGTRVSQADLLAQMGQRTGTTGTTGTGSVPTGTGGNAYQQWLAQMGYTLPSMPSSTGQPNVAYPAYGGQPASGIPNEWAEALNLTPEQLDIFSEFMNSYLLPTAQLTQNAQQYASDLANTQYQFGQQFPWQQYTDQAALDLANQQQGWQEQWLPEELRLTQEGLNTRQGADIANQQALQNQMVGWYGTQQANDLAWQREAQAAQLKGDASNAALSAWGRMNRPNARYL